MQIELKPVAEIRPYERNPRFSEKAVEAVAESIRRFGFRQPIVVDAEGVVVCGHARLLAAQRLGLAEVPVHVARDLSDEQIRAYRIADNKTAELAGWDEALLRVELGELKDANIDWSLLGFDVEELGRLLEGDLRTGLTDPDAVPAPPDEATTKRGDLWILGDHRLLCGDSSLRADLERVLAGERVQLVNTDPPYNVKVEPRSNNAIAAGLSSFAPTHHQSMDASRRPGASKATHGKLRPKDRPLANDFVSEAEFDRLLAAWFGNIAEALEPGGAFYIWGGYANCANYPPALRASQLYFSQAVIWVKEHPVLTRKDFMGNHEWCFYGWREGAGHHFYGPNNATDVWSVKKVSPQAMVHLTEKPVELAVRAMQYSSREGDAVLDLFGGSGSTLIGAEQCGRRARLIELDPLYCDVIVRRWEEFTGRKAVLEESPKARQERIEAGEESRSAPVETPEAPKESPKPRQESIQGVEESQAVTQTA
ncbi:MAG: ParB N-terminal domain-containing protein [Phycisphaerae bacterium]|nr:ParB N-terminal domain-containing protein [Phycisphaerae bacterium]